ncbi:MAG: 50S ribosomal protein L25 [Candidatus Pacebacteria bacterium]|nr:50S ribosomal protein L25 [Candidatus Paceibacterota bacterium]
MYLLKAELREKKENVRNEGFVPAILYGPQIKENVLLKVDAIDFQKIYKEAGETSLIEVECDGKKYPALLHDYENDPMTGEFIHIDFYSPNLKEEVEAEVKVEIIGIAPAVSLGGTLVQNIHVLHVKALPEDLPHKVQIDASKLITFEDYIDVESIDLGDKVKVLNNKEEIIASVVEVKANVEEAEVPKEENNEQEEKPKE